MFFVLLLTTYVAPFIIFSFFRSAAISAETMTLHHTKHHNTYVTNLNATIEKIDSAMTSGDVSATIALQGALKFNGGGHINHCLFWENLAPESSGVKAGGALDAAINERFGSLDGLKSEMSAKSLAIQGSGWGWLAYNPTTGKIIGKNFLIVPSHNLSFQSLV